MSRFFWQKKEIKDIENALLFCVIYQKVQEDMTMEKTQSFTEGKIFSPLIRFALPILLALFLQAMYGAVDLLIVGQFGGNNADVFVSAVSTGSQIMMTLTVVITGLAMGLTVYVGEKIGAGRRKEAGEHSITRCCMLPFVLQEHYLLLHIT